MELYDSNVDGWSEKADVELDVDCAGESVERCGTCDVGRTGWTGIRRWESEKRAAKGEAIATHRACLGREWERRVLLEVNGPGDGRNPQHSSSASSTSRLQPTGSGFGIVRGPGA